MLGKVFLVSLHDFVDAVLDRARVREKVLEVDLFDPVMAALGFFSEIVRQCQSEQLIEMSLSSS